MSSKMQPVRGTRDIFGDDSKYFEKVINVASDYAKRFNFQFASTPIFEFSEVFHRTLGETSDIISKETYTFADRDDTSITLRPEFTAGLVRAFISNGLTQSTPVKWFSYGPIFRYERPQKGRYRQFNQINFEALGVKGALSDVEMISLGNGILKELGIIKDISLELNTLGDAESRKHYREKLVQYFSRYEKDLSEDSKIRLIKNPLRILDSKDEGDKKIVLDAPKIFDCLNDESKKFFDDVQDNLELLNIRFKVNPKIVRGLDYYTHTVFEFVTDKLGAQGTVLAGGRYDGLVEVMGGPATPAVGFASGVERLMELMKVDAPLFSKSGLVYVLGIGDEGEKAAAMLAHTMREIGYIIEIDHGIKLAKKFQRADKLGAKLALIIGDEELKKQKIKVKKLETGEEDWVNIKSLSLIGI